MNQKPLGQTGINVSALALGTGTFGREIDEEESYRLMDYCFEKGITFFDTAEAYGGGQARENRRASLGIDDVRETTGELSSSERIIGSWMRARGVREQVTLCTKISGGHGKPEEIRKALVASLDRLQTDHVEVYKMHSPDPSCVFPLTPKTQVWRPLESYIKNDGSISTPKKLPVTSHWKCWSQGALSFLMTSLN